jgi:hypothetical protein
MNETTLGQLIIILALGGVALVLILVLDHVGAFAH